MRPPERERGAALLTVLLLVAVIAVLAGAALERVRLATRTAATAGAIGQARGYAVAAEALATIRLGNTLAADPGRVSLAGGWSGRPFPLPVPEGSALATLSDGGNCFNLNGLVRPIGVAAYAAEPAQVLAFGRLMRAVGVPAAAADPIAAAAADWIDTDAAPGPGGAEDDRYPGYRTGNTLMADPSELRAVAGVTPAIYATLRPWICTLPVPTPATINVDTLAPEQAPLVAAFSPDGALGVEQVRAALLARPAAGWASAGDFWAMPSLKSAGGATGGVAVTSQWFALRVDVAVGDARLEEHGLIDATQLPPRLVSRQWGEAS